MPETLLVGDVGGTWIRLALVDGCLSEVWKQPTRAFKNLGQAVEAFLAQTGAAPAAAAVGVAGPVDNDVARLTNLDWEARAEDLPQPAVLINDLAAAAHGVGVLGPGDARRISGPAPIEGTLRVVIGVGTGHGQATWSRGGVLAGEAGHAGFAPEDPELAELAQTIREQHGRASVESVISGAGLDAVLRFAAGRATLGPEATEALQSQPSAAVVARFAGQDSACARARSLFACALGGEAGNAALRCLPAGGVWLVGGVAQSLLQPAVDAEVQAAFCAKPPMSERLREIPLLVVSDPHVALHGAAVVARMLLH